MFNVAHFISSNITERPESMFLSDIDSNRLELQFGCIKGSQVALIRLLGIIGKTKFLSLYALSPGFYVMHSTC